MQALATKWTAFAAILLALVPGPRAFAQQVTAPGTATRPFGVPIDVQWQAVGYWPTSKVNLYLMRVWPNGWSPVNLVPQVVPNTGHAQFVVPAAMACDPVQQFMMTVESLPQNGTYRSRNGEKFRFSCEGGTISVAKVVVNDTGKPTPTLPFLVDVHCTPADPQRTLSLSAANGHHATLRVPLGSHCTLAEQPPKTPFGCRWSTTYPQGNTVDVVADGADYPREVHNRLDCQGITGSVQVTKQVIDESGTIPPPLTAFQAQVTCSTGGPKTLVTLSAANGYSQIVGNLPPGSQCTVVELPPMVPPQLARQGCHWETSYRSGEVADPGDSTSGPKRIVRTRAGSFRHTIINRWRCDGAGGDAPSGDSITVVKEIVNPTGTPLRDPQFQVRLDCKPAGPHQLLVLASPARLEQAIGVRPGSECTIEELRPVAPKGCSWSVSYPDGRQGKPGDRLVVRNELVCEPQLATLVVSKTIRDIRPYEPLAGTFAIKVVCSTGFTQNFMLGRGMSRTLPGLPVGTSCTVTETVPEVILSRPRSCPSLQKDPGGLSDMGLSNLLGPALWNPPAFAPAQTVTLAAGSNQVTINNSYRCAFAGPAPGDSDTRKR